MEAIADGISFLITEYLGRRFLMAVSLKKILGNMIDRFPLLVARKHDYQIGEMVKIFTGYSAGSRVH